MSFLFLDRVRNVPMHTGLWERNSFHQILPTTSHYIPAQVWSSHNLYLKLPWEMRLCQSLQKSIYNAILPLGQALEFGLAWKFSKTIAILLLIIDGGVVGLLAILIQIRIHSSAWPLSIRNLCHGSQQITRCSLFRQTSSSILMSTCLFIQSLDLSSIHQPWTSIWNESGE